MKYQTGNTRDEPSLAVLDAARSDKELALLECVLILVMCVSIILVPIIGMVTVWG